MTRTLLLAFLLLGLPLPAPAATVLPETFAKAFCQARDAGISQDAAIADGVSVALIPGDHWRYLTVNGKTHQSDVVAAIRAAALLCPHHFPAFLTTPPSST